MLTLASCIRSRNSGPTPSSLEDSRPVRRYNSLMGASTMLCRGPSQAPEASVNRRPREVDAAQRSAVHRTPNGGLLAPSRVVPSHSAGTSPTRRASSHAVDTHHMLQASLTVGPVDDPLEREADGVAALA